jgi:peptidyl-prolyl cis-trans isomerase B (cyclophilin B)
VSAALVALVLLALLLTGCAPTGGAGTAGVPTPTPPPTPSESPTGGGDAPGDNSQGTEEGAVSNPDNPLVTIEMENGAQIVLELYPDKAPNTVNNFISLIQQGFYDGLKFHRVADGFMIQGGDPEGTGIGGPGYGIPGEFDENGFEGNDVSHTEGVLSMARSSEPDSAGSQFFICDGDASFLDGQYAAFGCVVSGIDEVHRIADMVTNPNGGPPPEDQVMKRVTVDTRGKEYPAPETIPD